MFEGLQNYSLARRLKRLLLSFDSAADTFLFEGGRRMREAFEAYAAFLGRWRVTGA